MAYSVQWVKEHLGVTRDMIRYYEKENLLPKEGMRNTSNKYREYTDEDLELIWLIKLLIGIGFSAKEIRAFRDNSDSDFDSALAKKTKVLEERQAEITEQLEFAKSIKFSGRIPTVTKVGSVRFEDFLAHAHENWNMYRDPQMKHIAELIEPASNLSEEERIQNSAAILELFENSEISVFPMFILQGYLKTLAELRELPYSDRAVQNVVRLIHEHFIQHNTDPDLNGKITPQAIARHLAPGFMCGDLASMNEQNYGKEGCRFIAKALAYYGGYEIDEL